MGRLSGGMGPRVVGRPKEVGGVGVGGRPRVWSIWVSAIQLRD